MPPEFIDSASLAELAGISVQAARKAIAKGEIQGSPIHVTTVAGTRSHGGRMRLVSASSLPAPLQQRLHDLHANTVELETLALQQIESRIGARFFLPNLDHGDCDLIAKAYGVKDETALGAARTLGTKGNARELVQTLQMARHGAQGGAVSLSNIREALVLVTGKTDALKALDRAKR